jgi:hypothetical protein
MRAEVSPPRWPAWLLERLLPTPALDGALGDLAEEYALRANANPSHAPGAWYWMQIGRSMPSLVGLAFRSAGTLRTLLVAIAAFLSAGFAEGAINRVVALLSLSDPLRGVAGVIVGVTTMACAGYVAARIRPPAALVMAAITFAVIAVMMASGLPSPLVFELAFLIGAPAASIVGGLVAARRASQRIH